MNVQGTERECDVAVIGGALSGAAVALMLKRRDPSLRVVVIEKSNAFKRRVGEATVEVSGYFLCRVLGLTRFLTQTQMAKNGLRFWFSNAECRDLGAPVELVVVDDHLTVDRDQFTRRREHERIDFGE